RGSVLVARLRQIPRILVPAARSSRSAESAQPGTSAAARRIHDFEVVTQDGGASTSRHQRDRPRQPTCLPHQNVPFMNKPEPRRPTATRALLGGALGAVSKSVSPPIAPTAPTAKPTVEMPPNVR